MRHSSRPINGISFVTIAHKMRKIIGDSFRKEGNEKSVMTSADREASFRTSRIATRCLSNGMSNNANKSAGSYTTCSRPQRNNKQKNGSSYAERFFHCRRLYPVWKLNQNVHMEGTCCVVPPQQAFRRQSVCWLMITSPPNGYMAPLYAMKNRISVLRVKRRSISNWKKSENIWFRSTSTISNVELRLYAKCTVYECIYEYSQVSRFTGYDYTQWSHS